MTLSNVIRIRTILFLVCICIVSANGHAQTSRLDLILERGEIRIGTTGDYKPFTYLHPETGSMKAWTSTRPICWAKRLA